MIMIIPIPIACYLFPRMQSNEEYFLSLDRFYRLRPPERKTGDVSKESR